MTIEEFVMLCKQMADHDIMHVFPCIEVMRNSVHSVTLYRSNYTNETFRLDILSEVERLKTWMEGSDHE